MYNDSDNFFTALDSVKNTNNRYTKKAEEDQEKANAKANKEAKQKIIAKQEELDKKYSPEGVKKRSWEAAREYRDSLSSQEEKDKFTKYVRDKLAKGREEGRDELPFELPDEADQKYKEYKDLDSMKENYDTVTTRRVIRPTNVRSEHELEEDMKQARQSRDNARKSATEANKSNKREYSGAARNRHQRDVMINEGLIALDDPAMLTKSMQYDPLMQTHTYIDADGNKQTVQLPVKLKPGYNRIPGMGKKEVVKWLTDDDVSADGAEYDLIDKEVYDQWISENSISPITKAELNMAYKNKDADPEAYENARKKYLAYMDNTAQSVKSLGKPSVSFTQDANRLIKTFAESKAAKELLGGDFMPKWQNEEYNPFRDDILKGIKSDIVKEALKSGKVSDLGVDGRLESLLGYINGTESLDDLSDHDKQLLEMFKNKYEPYYRSTSDQLNDIINRFNANIATDLYRAEHKKNKQIEEQHFKKILDRNKGMRKSEYIRNSGNDRLPVNKDWDALLKVTGSINGEGSNNQYMVRRNPNYMYPIRDKDGNIEFDQYGNKKMQSVDALVAYPAYKQPDSVIADFKKDGIYDEDTKLRTALTDDELELMSYTPDSPSYYDPAMIIPIENDDVDAAYEALRRVAENTTKQGYKTRSPFFNRVNEAQRDWDANSLMRLGNLGDYLDMKVTQMIEKQAPDEAVRKYFPGMLPSKVFDNKGRLRPELLPAVTSKFYGDKKWLQNVLQALADNHIAVSPELDDNKDEKNKLKRLKFNDMRKLERKGEDISKDNSLLHKLIEEHRDTMDSIDANNDAHHSFFDIYAAQLQAVDTAKNRITRLQEKIDKLERRNEEISKLWKDPNAELTHKEYAVLGMERKNNDTEIAMSLNRIQKTIEDLERIDKHGWKAYIGERSLDESKNILYDPKRHGMLSDYKGLLPKDGGITFYRYFEPEDSDSAKNKAMRKAINTSFGKGQVAIDPKKDARAKEAQMQSYLGREREKTKPKVDLSGLNFL